MADDPKDPIQKKAKTSTESCSIEESIDKVNDDGPVFLEYADIRGKAELDLHLSNTREASIRERRYKLRVMEHALHKWYLRDDKYVCAEVCLKLEISAFNLCV